MLERTEWSGQGNLTLGCRSVSQPNESPNVCAIFATDYLECKNACLREGSMATNAATAENDFQASTARVFESLERTRFSVANTALMKAENAPTLLSDAIVDPVTQKLRFESRGDHQDGGAEISSKIMKSSCRFYGSQLCAWCHPPKWWLPSSVTFAGTSHSQAMNHPLHLHLSAQ